MDETKCFRTIDTFKAHNSSLPLQNGRPVVLIDTPTSKMKIVAGYLDQIVNLMKAPFTLIVHVGPRLGLAGTTMNKVSELWPNSPAFAVQLTGGSV